jgi:hypothetical protein
MAETQVHDEALGVIVGIVPAGRAWREEFTLTENGKPLSGLEGDYIVDLKSLDTSDTTADSAGRSVHWAHGVVTVRNEP